MTQPDFDCVVGELADKLDESKIFDDQSSGFGSGQNKTEIL